MSRRLLSPILVLLVATMASAACSDSNSTDNSTDATGGGTGKTAAATVDLKPSTFDPAAVTIKVGETVTWKWGGGVQHDVVGQGFKSKLQSKGTFDHTFDAAGTFDYKCEVHPTTMKGTVTVEG
jgi:plastocyanin